MNPTIAERRCVSCAPRDARNGWSLGEKTSDTVNSLPPMYRKGLASNAQGPSGTTGSRWIKHCVQPHWSRRTKGGGEHVSQAGRFGDQLAQAMLMQCEAMQWRSAKRECVTLPAAIRSSLWGALAGGRRQSCPKCRSKLRLSRHRRSRTPRHRCPRGTLTFAS